MVRFGQAAAPWKRAGTAPLWPRWRWLRCPFRGAIGPGPALAVARRRGKPTGGESGTPCLLANASRRAEVQAIP